MHSLDPINRRKKLWLGKLDAVRRAFFEFVPVVSLGMVLTGTAPGPAAYCNEPKVISPGRPKGVSGWTPARPPDLTECACF